MDAKMEIESMIIMNAHVDEDDSPVESHPSIHLSILLIIHPSMHQLPHLHLVEYLLSGLGLSDLIINIINIIIMIKSDDRDDDNGSDDNSDGDDSNDDWMINASSTLLLL